MILIADSGSTKTDWVLLNQSNILQTFKTPGINPYFSGTAEITDILRETFSNHIGSGTISEVYFYGAGCSSPDKQKVVEDALQAVFPGKKTEVEHDMLAAARALFANKPGIACILGTGSNACAYDGGDISESLFSPGYMFGDEGSGAHLGKTYIADHLKEKSPPEIMTAFAKRYGLSREDILTEIYRKSNPNRFLASFTHFLKEHLSHPYVHNLVKSCFEAFFSEQVSRFYAFRKYNLGCIGSVAYHFRDVFGQVAAENKAVVENIMVSPMEGLIKYHLEN